MTTTKISLCAGQSSVARGSSDSPITRIYLPSQLHCAVLIRTASLIAVGVNFATVARQWGHSKVSVTLSTYTHFVQSRSSTNHTSKLEAYPAELNVCVLVIACDSAPTPSVAVID